MSIPAQRQGCIYAVLVARFRSVTIEKHSSFSFSVSSSCASSSMACSSGAQGLFPLLLWFLEASANSLPCPAFMARSQAVPALTNMFGQTVLGPLRHLLVRSLRGCGAELPGLQGLIKSHSRQCETRWAAGSFALCRLTSSWHGGA